MSTVRLDAAWRAFGSGPGLDGGREANGTKQYVCRDNDTQVIGKLLGSHGYFAINGKEVARPTSAIEVHDTMSPNLDTAGWAKWTGRMPKRRVAATAMSYTISSTDYSGDEPVTESAEIAVVVAIARFSHKAGLHIGSVWLDPENVRHSSFSWGGGVITDAIPQSVVVWRAFKVNQPPPLPPGF
jgi:hypothetical protein